MSSYDDLAGARSLRSAPGFHPGPLTPLLAEDGSMELAHEGDLIAGATGTIGRFRTGRFEFHTVFTRVAESQEFVPRLMCVRLGRITSDSHYGFEVRSSRLWTESVKLNERFKVSVSPFQDDNWLRQLFVPTFIDWVGESSPGDFSFELAYGSLLCSVEEDDPDPQALAALWDAAATVTTRIRDESSE